MQPIFPQVNDIIDDFPDDYLQIIEDVLIIPEEELIAQMFPLPFYRAR